jgi:hypothetical protein
MIDLRRIVSREGPREIGGQPVTITVNTWVVALEGSLGSSGRGGVSHREAGRGGFGFAYRHPSRVEVGNKTAQPIHDYVFLVRLVCVLAIAATLLIRRRKT